MRGLPLFGIGLNQYAQEVGLTAHNSFVLCYVELGFIGGTFFFGMIYLSIEGLRLHAQNQLEGLDPELARLRPFIFAILLGTVMGMLSSSRSTQVTTYVIIG